jgi:hypothetical protein
MIHDLSLTLKKILDFDHPDLAALAAQFPELAQAEIAFEHPKESYNPQATTVNLFLYDIRENVDLRSNEPVLTSQNGQVQIQRPPLRVACSYLATAWAGSAVTGEQAVLLEHKLLSQVLQVLARFPTIPAFILQSSLVGQEPLLPMLVAQMDGLRNPAEFWTALGNKLRPSLAVTVTLALETAAPEVAPMAITQAVHMGILGAPSTQETLYRIAGHITDAQDQAVAEATVTLVEAGLVATTDADGAYSLGLVAAGTYTLHVESGIGATNVAIKVPEDPGENYDVQLP